MDIPEFYELVQELFTPEEAAVCNAVPRGIFSAGDAARALGRPEAEVKAILEGMADKGLCFSIEEGGMRIYGAAPFVPGIMEYQFMRGTATERDKKIARLIHAYKQAVDALRNDAPEALPAYPQVRVIPIEEAVAGGDAVKTYHQVMSYIDKYDMIAVSTCYFATRRCCWKGGTAASRVASACSLGRVRVSPLSASWRGRCLKKKRGGSSKRRKRQA